MTFLIVPGHLQVPSAFWWKECLIQQQGGLRESY